MEGLRQLLDEYHKAPEIFQAGRYWKAYENRIIDKIATADISELRSGKYPILGTFGFNEAVYKYHPNTPFYKKIIYKTIRRLFITNKGSLPYSLRLSDLREMAYHHCLLQGTLSKVKSIAAIETSTFGNPSDLFVIDGKKYTMRFLSMYIRLCFAHQHLQLKGDEILVELGSGSGLQVEVLKKIYPDLTILCFDLPYSLYLCEQYLRPVLGEEMVVSSTETLSWEKLDGLQKGKVHFFGNWKFPLLENQPFDIFWNAASFGEMEPHIVRNYLQYVLPNCSGIYLLQAGKGKESSDKAGVVTPITFQDYDRMLSGFRLVKESDAMEAHRRLSDSGGYFQAAWRNVRQTTKRSLDSR